MPSRKPIGSNGPRDVLHRLLAHVLERAVELSAHLVVDLGGYADAAGLGERFQSGGDVDTLAVNILALDDDVTEIDANAQVNALVGRCAVIALRHLFLNSDRAFDSIDDAPEFGQKPVTHELEDAAVVFLDFGL